MTPLCSLYNSHDSLVHVCHGVLGRSWGVGRVSVAATCSVMSQVHALMHQRLSQPAGRGLGEGLRETLVFCSPGE